MEKRIPPGDWTVSFDFIRFLLHPVGWNVAFWLHQVLLYPVGRIWHLNASGPTPPSGRNVELDCIRSYFTQWVECDI